MANALAWIQAIAAALYTLATIILLVIVSCQTKAVREQTQAVKEEVALVREQHKFVRQQQDFVLKRERKARAEQRSNEFYSERMLVVRACACEKFGEASPEIREIFNLFETLGADFKAGEVDIEGVRKFLQDPILFYWYGWGDWTKKYREHEGDDTIFADYEALVGALLTTGVKRPPQPVLDA